MAYLGCTASDVHMSNQTTPSAPPADGGAPPDLTAALQHAKDSLARMQPKLPANFRFRWRASQCQGRVDRLAGKLRLRLVCDLGRVPFSAEDAKLRAQITALVRWSQSGAKYRFTVTAQQRLALIAENAIAEPYAGEDALAQAIAILADARPLIDIVLEQHRDAVA
jgi:type II secretory pathway component PulK